MSTARTLALAAFALASLPLLAQQAPSTNQPPGAPAVQQPATPQQPAQQPEEASPAPAPAAAADTAGTDTFSPVNGELVDKLDTKTAKTGDAVVIKTRSTVKTANGTEIPKGSKLIGRVTAVRPVGQGNPNAQVALQFDHAELKGGQSLPIHAEIQGLSTSDTDAPDTMAASPGPSPSPAAGATPPGGSMNGPSAAAAGSTTAQPQMSSSSPNAGSAATAPGTVVARTGNIAIRTTSIPGVLLASNEPGQHDPRMAQSSGILLGPQHDIHLDGGTRVVVGVSVTGATGNPGGE